MHLRLVCCVVFLLLCGCVGSSSEPVSFQHSSDQSLSVISGHGWGSLGQDNLRQLSEPWQHLGAEGDTTSVTVKSPFPR